MNATTDADSLRELQESFVNYYANTLTFNYADLAVFVVLVFEYLITFDREVHFAWGHKLSWARGIFFLNRYLGLVEYFVVLGPLLPVVNYTRQVFQQYEPLMTLTHVTFSCVLLTRLTQAVQIVLYAVWAAFSGVRVYAISGRNTSVTVLVLALAMVPVVTNAYVAMITSVHLADVGFDLNVRLSIATRSCMIVSDAIVIIVTWVKTWGTIRIAQRLQVEMCFTSLVLKEGILYFAIMLSLNVVQIIFNVTQASSYGFIIPFVNVMTPILISRFFLDLDDLTSHDYMYKSPSSGAKTNVLAWSSTLQFVDPASSVSDYTRSALAHSGVHSEYRLGESDPALVTRGYRPAATW
ncbi:hypothetical protein C8Q76DRAFT_799334 [Earliella scabrosa]|nr:hypothetical protein C8Q76DRAFT_799334 [Earliella scabrosa]